MKSQIASASKIIAAPAGTIYNIIADFRNEHPHILPKQYFQSLEVEEGGFGAGTITRFQMRLLGQTQNFRTLITEPEPRRVLVETDLASGAVTTFTVSPLGNDQRSQVTIATEYKARNAIEAFLAKVILQKVYREELSLLTKFVEERALENSASAEARSTLSK
jgi:hypothetical protein